MKVALIEPTSTKANVYSKLHMPLLGSVYLGTILKNRGHEVEIYNEDIYRPDYSQLNADIIGISILTSTSKRGYEIAKRFPKEKVYEELSMQKRIFSHDWNLYDGQHVVFKPKLLSARQLQLNVIRAYTKFYSLSRSFSLLFRLHLRNAMFNFMGYSIIKKWIKANLSMHWLRQPRLNQKTV